jgi:hypothetical protein
MRILFACCLLLDLASDAQGGRRREPDATYGFATRQYMIEMRVSFPDSYAGRRLVFYSTVEPRKQICLPIDGTPSRCIDRFVGAVATVKYSVKFFNGAIPGPVALREHVTLTSQSPGLTGRAPFSMTKVLPQGIGSDLQVFGYDEALLMPDDHARARKETLPPWWRLYRQELYVDQEKEPFAIVEWKHTLNRISIVAIYSPAVKETSK